MYGDSLNAVDVEDRKAEEGEGKRGIENAQLKYKHGNTRYIKLYGNGVYDFGAATNADMGVFIEVFAFPFLPVLRCMIYGV